LKTIKEVIRSKYALMFSVFWYALISGISADSFPQVYLFRSYLFLVFFLLIPHRHSKLLLDQYEDAYSVYPL
jgi:hypothetical protein